MRKKVQRIGLLIMLLMIISSTGLAQKTWEEYFKTGNEQIGQKNYDGAISSYSECIKLAPTVYNCYYNRAIAYNNKAALEPARADKWSVTDGLTVLNPIRVLALNDINKAIQLDSKISGAYSIRGDIYFVEAIFDKAAADYRQSLALEPNLATSNPALFDSRNKRIADADTRYKRFPLAKAMDLLFRAAPIYSRDKTAAQPLYREALEFYKLAVARDKLTDEILKDRAFVYQRMGNYDAAIADYTEVLKINAGKASYIYASALIGRADTYLLQNKTALALADYEQVAKLPETDELKYEIADAVIKRANTLVVSGQQIDSAIDVFSKILAKNEKYTAVYYYRGLAYLKKNDQPKAIADFKKTVELDPKHEGAMTQLQKLGIQL